MWFRRLFDRLNRWAALKEVRPGDEVSEVRVALECLNPSSFLKLNVAKACKAKFRSNHSNLLEFAQSLNALSQQNYDNEKLTIPYSEKEAKEITLELFLHNSSGVRLNLCTSIRFFKDSATRLLVRYDQELSKSETGYAGYNSRLVKMQLLQAAKIADLLRTNS